MLATQSGRPPFVAGPVLFAPPGDQCGPGYRIVVESPRGKLWQPLPPTVPVAEAFPMLADRLRSVMALGVRAAAKFWVEPVERRR